MQSSRAAATHHAVRLHKRQLPTKRLQAVDRPVHQQCTYIALHCTDVLSCYRKPWVVIPNSDNSFVLAHAHTCNQPKPPQKTKQTLLRTCRVKQQTLLLTCTIQWRALLLKCTSQGVKKLARLPKVPSRCMHEQHSAAQHLLAAHQTKMQRHQARATPTQRWVAEAAKRFQLELPNNLQVHLPRIDASRTSPVG